MAAVPVVINGVFMPSNKSAGGQPIKGQMIGYLSIAGLTIGGGPIIPPEISPPDGSGNHPDNTLPGDLPPPDVIDPPPSNPPPNVAVVLKPAPTTGGWGLAADPKTQTVQWFFTPGAVGAGPKR